MFGTTSAQSTYLNFLMFFSETLIKRTMGYILALIKSFVQPIPASSRQCLFCKHEVAERTIVSVSWALLADNCKHELAKQVALAVRLVGGLPGESYTFPEGIPQPWSRPSAGIPDCPLDNSILTCLGHLLCSVAPPNFRAKAHLRWAFLPPICPIPFERP